MIVLVQAGSLKHDDICDSLRRFGRGVSPAFRWTRGGVAVVLRYSAPTCAPFSATERRMRGTRKISKAAIAAEVVKTSKYASDSACRLRACSSSATDI